MWLEAPGHLGHFPVADRRAFSTRGTRSPQKQQIQTQRPQTQPSLRCDAEPAETLPNRPTAEAVEVLETAWPRAGAAEEAGSASAESIETTEADGVFPTSDRRQVCLPDLPDTGDRSRRKILQSFAWRPRNPERCPVTDPGTLGLESKGSG
jgi:hypothetical protein